MPLQRILLYEFVTGGGCWSMRHPGPPRGTLLAEGKAMLQAVAHDLLAIGTVELHLLADARLTAFWPDGARLHEVRGSGDERRQLQTLAAECDLCLLIAPEFDDLLLRRCQWVTDAGGRLNSPDAALIALAANKTQLANHLSMAGIPVPRSASLLGNIPVPPGFPFPAVLKPVAGAGSLDVRLIGAVGELEKLRTAQTAWRLEAFHRGIAVSVAVLCGPNQTLVLPPGQQLLSDDGRFAYLGSAWPLANGHCERAIRLATRVVTALPSTQGYVGIDLVLGDAEDGCDDVVIEVNPRLTTSYVGLRQFAETNLAEAMLLVANGQPATIAWRKQSLRYQVEAT